MKRIGINLLLAVQICMCIIALNYSFIEINQLGDNIDIIESIENKNTIFVMVPREVRMAKKENAVNLNVINTNYELGEASKVSIMTNYGNASLFLYSDALISNMNIPLSKGNWDSSVRHYNGGVYYTLIINSEKIVYKFGGGKQFILDNYLLYLLYLKYNQHLNNQTIGVYIAGVLADDQKYISLSTSTNSMLADHLIGQCNKKENVFFCNKLVMPEYIQNNEFEYYNKIIFMDNNLDIQQFDETVKQLKNQAYIETLEDLLYNSNANIRMYQGYYGPLCICLCIVSVVGLLSYSMLLSNRNRKYYSNVLLCGGTKRDCVILSFFNVLFINLLSLIMLIIICNFFVLKGVYTFESIKLLNIAITTVVLLLNTVMSYVMVLITTQSKSLVQLVNKTK